MWNKIWCPKISAFNQSALAALGVFPFTYTQLTFANSKYLLSLEDDESFSSGSMFDTIQLTCVLFTIGAYVGNYLVIHLLQSMSPRRIFLIADVSIIISQASVMLLYIPFSEDFHIVVVTFLIARILAGLGNGMNLSFSIVYIQQMTTKKSFPILVIFIPLVIQLGLLAAIVTNVLDPATKQYFVIQQLVPIAPLLLRITLFTAKCADETPHYYYFIEKDESKALRVLDKIHISLQGQGRRNFQSQELYYSQSSQKNKSSFVELSTAVPQMQLQKLPNLPSLYNNLTPENLYGEPFFIKFAKCVAIVMFAQFTGFYVITTDARFINLENDDEDSTWLLIGVVVSIVTIMLNFYLSQVFKKIWLVVLGQSFLSSGLLLFAIDHHITKAGTTFRYIASIFYFFGYSLGIGTFAFILVPQMVPDIGILQTNLFQWFFVIVCQCLVAIYNNKEMTHLNQRETVYETTFYYFFGASLIGIGVLYIILKKDVRIRTPTKRSRKKSDEKRNSEENQFISQ